MKNNSLRSNVAPQDDEQQTSPESHGHDDSDADHADGGHDEDGHGHDHLSKLPVFDLRLNSLTCM